MRRLLLIGVLRKLGLIAEKGEYNNILSPGTGITVACGSNSHFEFIERTSQNYDKGQSFATFGKLILYKRLVDVNDMENSSE